MGRTYRVIGVVGCLLASLCAGAQVGNGARKVVLPSPQLIHCRSMECSQLWRHSGEGRTVYPSQVLTDIVDGEVVGLTAVYDKSVSTQELQSAIDGLYAKWKIDWGKGRLWRVEPEKLTVQLADWNDGTNWVIYLKVAHRSSDLVPSAHINSPHTDCDK